MYTPTALTGRSPADHISLHLYQIILNIYTFYLVLLRETVSTISNINKFILFLSTLFNKYVSLYKN